MPTETKTVEEQIAEIKTAILAELQGDQKKLSDMQRQLDALDLSLAERHMSGTGGKSLLDLAKENDQVGRLIADRRGRAVMTFKGNDLALFERKTTMTSSGQGFQVTGVMPIDRVPGITPEARQQLRVRDLLTARPTTLAVVDFLKVGTPLGMASPIAEASEKFQNTLSFTSVSEKVRTLATWLPATKQVLDDLAELMGFIQESLPYYVNLAEENQLLNGDSTGENLDGLIHQATSYTTSLTGAGAWNRIDIIGRVIQQITAAKELAPTFVIVHPNDYWALRLTKDSFGRYIMGDPMEDSSPNLFGLTLVSTTSIAAGTFLVGSGSPVACSIRDRMEMQVEISTEHQDFFTKNLVAIRAEKRLALIVPRPGSFIVGTFTTSPAGQ